VLHRFFIPFCKQAVQKERCKYHGEEQDKEVSEDGAKIVKNSCQYYHHTIGYCGNIVLIDRRYFWANPTGIEELPFEKRPLG
jgi:hypothetical protein